MFALTALVYPVVLAVLCVGAGLLVDRAAAASCRARCSQPSARPR